MTMPKLGIDDNRAALARLTSRSDCSAGIKNATPLMKTNELKFAPSEIDSIAQRRPAPTNSVAIHTPTHPCWKPCKAWASVAIPAVVKCEHTRELGTYRDIANL